MTVPPRHWHRIYSQYSSLCTFRTNELSHDPSIFLVKFEGLTFFGCCRNINYPKWIQNYNPLTSWPCVFPLIGDWLYRFKVQRHDQASLWSHILFGFQTKNVPLVFFLPELDNPVRVPTGSSGSSWKQSYVCWALLKYVDSSTKTVLCVLKLKIWKPSLIDDGHLTPSSVIFHLPVLVLITLLLPLMDLRVSFQDSVGDTLWIECGEE